MATPELANKVEDAEKVIQLVVLAWRRAQNDREDGGVQADQRGASRPGEGGRDERADRQEPDQSELAAVDGIDDGDDRHPQDRHGGGNQISPVPRRSSLGWVFLRWSRHASPPPDSQSWA